MIVAHRPPLPEHWYCLISHIYPTFIPHFGVGYVWDKQGPTQIGMTLTQQFLLLSLLPLSFLGMLVYGWRSGARRGKTLQLWSLVLVLCSLWASSVLRLFTGTQFSAWVVYTWGIVGDYMFSLAALAVLLTTLQFLSVPRERGMVLATISGGVVLASLVLDPAIWGSYIPDFSLAGSRVRHFDLWGGVWVAGWLLSLLAAWLLTRQVRRRLPLSLYLNQMNYWALMLVLFAVGGIIAAVQDPGQPIWQEVGLLLVVPAALVGTLSVSRSQLPDLSQALRLFLHRFSGSVVVFGLTWLALWGITQGLSELLVGVNNRLLLVLAAAVFALLFTLTYRWVNRFTERIFSPSAGQAALAEMEFRQLLTALPEPQRLADAFGGVLQGKLRVNEVWLFVPEDGPGGGLVLRPFTSKGLEPPGLVQFGADSPFAQALRQRRQPIMQHDVDILRDFRDLDRSEREMLDSWQRVLYVPVLAEEVLAGVLVLGAKQGGLPYNQADFTLLMSMVEQFGPLLVQARTMANLLRVNDFVFTEKEALGRENRQLLALTQLYGRFLERISPDLKRPLHEMAEQLAQLPEPLMTETRQLLQQRLHQVEDPFDRLVQTATRLQKCSTFHLEMVQMDDIARAAQRRLQAMAEARQIHMELDAYTKIPPVLGDPVQLTEAVQHVLHNAIKFNRVGGVVNVTCGTEGDEVYVRILDQGVGMSEAQLNDLWVEFPALQTVQNNGTGQRPARLGLTLAQFIMRAHGGRIEAESKYGSGSVFTLYLPQEFAESER